MTKNTVPAKLPNPFENELILRAREVTIGVLDQISFWRTGFATEPQRFLSISLSLRGSVANP